MDERQTEDKFVATSEVETEVGQETIPEVEEPEKVVMELEDVTEKDLIEAVKYALSVSPLIEPNKILVNTVFTVMKSLYLEKKRFAVIEAPTGSGKTIIGFLLYFATNYLVWKQGTDGTGEPYPMKKTGYFLTSAKLLQEQIDADLDRFDFRKSMSMLKGVANYDCTLETKKLKPPYQLDKNNKEITRISYAERPCKGLTGEQLQSMYGGCVDGCPYRVARMEGADASMTIFNYAYFLNVLRTGNNPFFSDRLLTIGDEGHLIPDIVTNIFNFEFTQYAVNNLYSLSEELHLGYGKKEFSDAIKDLINPLYHLFTSELKDITQLKPYFLAFQRLGTIVDDIMKDPELEQMKQKIGKNADRILEVAGNFKTFEELMERPEDTFIESEVIGDYNIPGKGPRKLYKHIVKDLSESRMVRKHFLKNVNKAVFMSATLGNIDEYAEMMGIEKDEFIGFRLPSTFDFTKSPIYLTQSGWLNFKNFQSNIDKVLMDTIKICNTWHPNEKGIIHTATFKIANLLKAKVEMKGLVTDPSRFLFYSNAMEKEACINRMKNSQKPYIIIGPSLYEGIDLKNDLGRFNILIKVPYSALSAYIKRKMDRLPFWYKRNTIEKIIQAIGRTNRNKTDYSAVYCLDAMFDNIIWETNDVITKRVEYKRI